MLTLFAHTVDDMCLEEFVQDPYELHGRSSGGTNGNEHTLYFYNTFFVFLVLVAHLLAETGASLSALATKGKRRH